MCPTTGIAYQDPEPNSFSFNSPYGACPKCNGLGEITEVDINKLIPDWNKSIKNGGITALNPESSVWLNEKISNICKEHGVSITTKLKDFPKKFWILFFMERKNNLQASI